ncbi:alpha/beta fold hydrolase [Spirosoma sp. HMF4905]|uniref:Alpha/beta fold hydrolase n=1 Tax=Spirosoma arboris TaxID=2682092 RepID=A0A7K1SKW4_9BACT|nr:alpha/beta fold hydrolase [Spirosoma arboris]MVM34451.1 alpha/beta fold hydrolase [Spirosoma arboris]
MKTLKSIFLALLLGLLSGCAKQQNDNPSPRGVRGSLLEVSTGQSLTKTQVVANVSEFSIQDVALYDVTYYVLTYQTEYKGQPIATRGLLMLPNGVPAPRLLAYFHGTQPTISIVDKTTIPSHYKGEAKDFYEVRAMALTWASAGYAVFLPDYIGYGSTTDQEHPYMCFGEMFKSNVDGLLAAKAFLTSKGYPADKRLLLTGWSQGGGAMLSAHRFLQEQYADDFTVLASSGLAGPYHFSEYVDYVLRQRTQHQPVVLITSWSLYALNRFTGLKRPTDQIWSYPVYDQISAALPPSTVPDQIFNHRFLAGLLEGSDQAFSQILQANSFHENWRPVGKVFLHHGDADDVVPYFNSLDAYTGLKARGADVKLYTYPGGKHDTEVSKFVLTTLSDFNQLL